MTPVKSIGLLWDAKAIPAAASISIYNPDAQNNGNACFGPNASNALFVGVAGDVHLVLWGGKNTLIFKNVSAGIWMGMPPFVHVTAGSTATSIIVGITAG